MKTSPTLKDIYKAGKKFYQQNNQHNLPVDHLVDMNISESHFTDYRLKLALQNIYRDIISPITIIQEDSSVQLLENVVPFVSCANPSSLGGVALGLKDILYKGMSTSLPISENKNQSGIYFGKIWVPEIQKQIVVELSSTHMQKGYFQFHTNNQQYEILEGCWVAQPLIYKHIFEYPFKTLYLLYKYIHFFSQNSNKLILYKHGLSDLFAGADLRKMDTLKQELWEQAQDIIKKNLIVLDEKDRFELPTFKLEQADKIMDFVYTELANMLLVPQTKIRGLAPQGMNATGEYDDINYARTLEGFRENYLYPVLNTLKIPFITSHYDDQAKLKMLQEFANHFDNIQKSGLEEIYRKQLFTTLGILEHKER